MSVHPFHKSQEQGEIKLHKKIERYEWSKRNTRINYLDIHKNITVCYVGIIMFVSCAVSWLLAVSNW